MIEKERFELKFKEPFYQEHEIEKGIQISAGGRFISLKITIREDRQAIQIIAIDNSLAEIPLYEGYCKSVEYLRLLLQNLFGGDGHDEEWINNQFNGKLYIENKEQ